MNITPAMIKMLVTILGLLSAGISAVWYTANKTTQIEEQEKHLEHNDIRLDSDDTKLHDFEIRILRLELGRRGP